MKGKSAWSNATVPGTVHADLLRNKMIEDPFYGLNEKQIQSLENEDWEYKTTFEIDKKHFSQKHIELHFDGLDTYAKVYVNDSLVLSSDNMFRTYSIDVKRFLKVGNNDLYVLFESAVKKGKVLASQIPYTLPGGEKVFTRKAQYQYGWDWGPRFVTCGIWKSVYLSYWNEMKIESFHHCIKELNDSIAKIQFVTKILSDKDQDVGVMLFSDSKTHRLTELEAKKLSDRPILESFEKKYLKKGINFDTSYYIIHHPELWWCNGFGKAKLYSFTMSILKDFKANDSKNINVGLRKIELVQQKSLTGSSFYFKLNGIPVFMKGANYIPQDNFIPRVTAEEYKNVVAQAKNANMNMLRVWGGGVYADNKFYKECDEQGILVWQDLMFACAMYPGDQNFLDNVNEEIKQQVSRIQDHACLALWCGNNEVDEGWKNWEWQKEFKYTTTDSLKIWNDYQKLFQDLIPKVIKESGSEIAYWPSSPSIGWGHPESLKQGDSHYWGVWWGNEPFENYTIKIGKFMSEYGFQSLPEISTFRKIAPESDLDLNSDIVKSHQKNAKGFTTIQTYMERDFKVPQKFEDYIYVSQLLQARGMQIAIEAHRSAKPYCMGTLMWQLNDCWPVTSWSMIDWYNNKKAIYYSTRNLFRTVLVAPRQTEKTLDFTLVSDSLNEFLGDLKLELKNFKGQTLWSKSESMRVYFTSNATYSIHKADLPKYDSAECYVNIKLSCKEAVLYSSNFLFCKPKNCMFPKSNLTITKVAEDTYTVISDVFSRSVCISSENGAINGSDNYFDLEPNQPKTIKISSADKDKNNLKLKAICLNNL
jgi:beta-mannosidase